MARVATCDCGATIRGRDDEDLFQRGKVHMAEAHPSLVIPDEEFREIVRGLARTVPG